MSHDMKRELHGDKSLLPSVPALEIVLPLSRRTRQRHRREGREIILLLSGDSSRHVEFMQFLCDRQKRKKERDWTCHTNGAFLLQ